MKKRIKNLGIKNIRINKSGCLGQCKQGVTSVIYPQNTWHSIQSNEDVENIIIAYHIIQVKNKEQKSKKLTSR